MRRIFKPLPLKYLAILLIVVCTACKYDSVGSLELARTTQPCTTVNVSQVPWIIQLFNTGCGVCFKDVYASTYKGQAVYYIPCGGPACDCFGGMTLLDCQGQVVKTLTNSSADVIDAHTNLAPLVKIYSCN
jgi:hypothetical protein